MSGNNQINFLWTDVLCHRENDAKKQKDLDIIHLGKNQNCGCIYCGNVAAIREYVPSKTFLVEPYEQRERFLQPQTMDNPLPAND